MIFREHSYINPVLLVSVFEGLISVVAYSFDARNGGGLGYILLLMFSLQ